MTYLEVAALTNRPLVAGHAFDKINRFFESFARGRGSDSIEGASYSTLPLLNPREDTLRILQDSISNISMHLPAGFARGLNRQFANMMDEDAWQEEDELIGSQALNAFTQLLVGTKTRKRPGIGTNGRGSITASWSVGRNRLVVECLPSEQISMVLCRETDNGEIERAAYGPINPRRALEILTPFNPGVWFDG